MSDLWSEDLDKLELVEGALLLNSQIDSEFNLTWVEMQLEKLLSEAELALSKEVDERARFDAFLRLFYQEWGFKGDYESYFSSENAFIDKVIERRKGIPVSLGALLLFFGRKLGFRIQGISFPTQFVISISWDAQQISYINPFNGEYVAKSVLHAWLKGQDGQWAQLKPEHLNIADNSVLIGRWLGVLKNAFMREERYTQALACTDLALSLVPDDPYEIRDRGFIYQHLQCLQVARQDFEYFLEKCPQDPTADLLKLQLRALQEVPTVLH
ncbi:SirB1 family protein [Vibrio gallicus]|uniref:SirB1 family protein n=1 Tax=Vibrio gallicus TaxID=190897 RepID=UPI0021C30D46|nr:SirB1 family protein [Vibrio gallicus]